MDLRYSEAEQAFRAEVRKWLRAAVAALPSPPAPGDLAGRRRFESDWQRRLYDAGYAGIDWPVDVGGRGATPTEHLIFLEEYEAARAPYVGVNFVGLLHAGPTLIAEATPAQKARYLPAVLKGEEIWCQGFSEPGAGSDLASLSTRAARDGDHYVVTGQKIWTSHAQVSDLCELLVRTDPDAPKHRGITWLILPMSSPGIEIRPLRTLLGSEEFSEVFLDGVRVPVANRVGAENDGWRVAMVTFSFERGTAFVGELLHTMKELSSLATLARRVTRSSALAWEDAGIRREVGRLVADFDALWAMTLRNVSEASRTGTVGTGGSVFKLHYSLARQRMSDLAMRVLGRAGVSLDDLDGLPTGHHVHGWLYARSLTIAAGTAQIQRNIVGERVLGLPKER